MISNTRKSPDLDQVVFSAPWGTNKVVFPFTVFKFISKHLIINWFSTRNHPDSWLPWINPTRTRDRAGLQKPSSKRRGRK